MTTIYHYSPKTFEFVGQSDADNDPLDNLPMIPAMATTDVPPAAGSNQAAVFKNNAWTLIDDFRGYIGYDAGGIEQKITEINISPDPSWTLTAPFVFADAKSLKTNEINALSTAALEVITSQYTRSEIDSWPTQEDEANAWSADNNAPTPLLDAMVANRPSVDKAGLVLRILTNATNYKAFSGAVIGKKQALEDKVNALKTTAKQADIDAIVVEF